jgi:cystathionine gamma-synthase
MAGSLESWLLLRSLCTLHLRVARQSQNAAVLAEWLARVAKTPKGETFDGVPGGIVIQASHASLQGPDARG